MASATRPNLPPPRRSPRRWPSSSTSSLTSTFAPLAAQPSPATSPCPRAAPPPRWVLTSPITYVPARNTIFLSFALAWAETLGSSDIFIGVNALDYSGYPDCRPEYIHAYQTMANLATRAGVEGKQHLIIHTPLISLTKAQIIRRGLDLGVDYSLTSTCYDPDHTGRACGQCDACLLRLKGFAENGMKDPAIYLH